MLHMSVAWEQYFDVDLHPVCTRPKQKDWSGERGFFKDLQGGGQL